MKSDMRLRHFYFLLLTSIILFQCSSPLKKYELTAIRWEKDIQEFEKLDTTEKYAENAILFTGSSSIRLWKTIEKDMAPYPVIQRGFGGSTMSDVAYYIKRIVYPHQFRAVVVFVANDISGKITDKTPEEVLNLFTYIHHTIRNKFPDKPIYFIEITPTNSRWTEWPKIQKVNDMAKQFCQSRPNTYFIETASLYLGADGKPNASLFAEDQLHQNWEGYKIWTKAIKDKLDATLK
ncbi:GDSL-type esterase/lipase family protein [Xanthocytophaga flava]|nr:GDSL-type esterase/lipase family protein [Xanthocytophaga flavus]